MEMRDLRLKLATIGFFLFSGFVHGQVVEAVDIDGNSIGLVVPQGYCKLSKGTEPDRGVYERMQSLLPRARLLMVFVACGEVQEFRKGGLPRGFQDFGAYAVQTENGIVHRMPLSQDRAKLVAEVVEASPLVDVAKVEKAADESLKRGLGVDVTKRVIGLAGFDANAFYIASGSNVSTEKTDFGRRWQVLATTLLKGYVILVTRSEMATSGVPFEHLLKEQKARIAELVKLN